MADASFHGKHGYVLIGKETAWGTAVTPSKDIGLVQNFSPDFSNSVEERYSVGSNAVQALTSGIVDITGSSSVLFQHGRLLEYAMGSVSHALTGSDTRHTFTVADDLPAMTIEEGYNSTGTDRIQRWAGVRVTGLTLTHDVRGILTVDWNWLAKTAADSTTSQASVISTLPLFRGVMGSLTFGAESSEATVNDVQSFKFAVNNYSQGDTKLYGIGSRLAAAAEASGRSLTFAFTAGFRNHTEWERALGSTSPLDTGAEIADSGLIWSVNNGVALGSGRRDIYLDLSDAMINTVGKPMNIGGYILQDFAGFARTIDSFYSTDNIAEASW